MRIVGRYDHAKMPALLRNTSGLGLANRLIFLGWQTPKQLQRGLANLESLICGDYTKHSDNTGKICSARDVPQALSHYTYRRSRRQLLQAGLGPLH